MSEETAEVPRETSDVSSGVLQEPSVSSPVKVCVHTAFMCELRDYVGMMTVSFVSITAMVYGMLIECFINVLKSQVTDEYY
jgi:hypothetical protein